MDAKGANTSLPAWVASLPQAWTEGLGGPALEQARTAYDSAGRHYHTWAHVQACVRQLFTFECDQPRLVFLALVFHDAVYVAGRRDNEQRSAALAHAVLVPFLSVGDLNAIERMILATADHHAQAVGLPHDALSMLDIDLSILGATRADYARYAQQVMREYVPAVATEAAFRIGRLAFLRNAVSLPHIYFTNAARARWEQPARDNIAWEIDDLATKQGLAERAVSMTRESIGD